MSIVWRLLICFCFSICNHRIDFPPEVIRGESLFTNMVIDETTSQPSNNCDDVFVYITDTVEPGTFRTCYIEYVILCCFN